MALLAVVGRRDKPTRNTPAESQVQDQATSRRGRRRKAFGAVAVVALVVLAAEALALSTTGDSGDTSCKAELEAAQANERRDGESDREPARAADEPNALPQPVDSRAEATEEVAQLVFPFGADREPLSRHQVLRIPRDMPLEDVRVTAPFGDLADAAGRPASSEHIRAEPIRTGPGRLLTVGICVNPLNHAR